MRHKKKGKSNMLLVALFVTACVILLIGIDEVKEKLFLNKTSDIQATVTSQSSEMKESIDNAVSSSEKPMKESTSIEKDSSTEEKEKDTVFSENNDEVNENSTGLNESSEEPSQDSYQRLEMELRELCKDKGVWAIYIKDLRSGKSLSINNKKMVAASLIKLFIMAKTYQAIQDGDITRTEQVNNMLRKMITISHNDSSNKLVEIIGHGSHEKGMEIVNQYAVSIACGDTEQQRDMLDFRPKPTTKENYTSVEDCGKLLEKIYNKECINSELDQEMMDLLLAQQRNTKIPALLPRGTKIAHKTGELSHTENDVGIVFGSKSDYIICVMSNELKDTGQARSLIGQISKIVYDFFES